MKIAAAVFMLGGMIFMLAGLIGIIRYRTFYRRLLVSALIDTAGVLLILGGAALWAAPSAFSLKILLMMGIILLTAPLVSHKLGRSAYLSGHRET